MTSNESEKRRAGRLAAEEVRSGDRLGLGTGSTVRHFLEALAERITGGEIHDIVGIPTSARTEQLARELGIPLTTFEAQPWLSLAVDGADEVSPSLDLVKGLGGALLREKIVATAARSFLVVVDRSKEVERLGTRAPLPVEVTPFGWSTHLEPFRAMGAEPRLRRWEDGDPVRTDNGNFLFDLVFEEGIGDPAALERAILARPGVVETGLFLGMADVVFVGSSDEVVRRVRPGGAGLDRAIGNGASGSTKEEG